MAARKFPAARNDAMSGQRSAAWVQWLAIGGIWASAANAWADVLIPRTDVLYVLGAAPGGGSTTQFGMIELSTGKYTRLVSNVNGTQSLHNLAWSPQLGGFYTSAGNLVRTLGVDGTLGATVHAFGTAERFTGLAHLSASDQLVAYSYELGGSSDHLRVGDMPTASWTTLTQDSGLVNSSYAGRLVAHQGALYATLRDVSTAPTVGRFGTYDTTAGATFQQIASHFSFQFMTLASDGETLYGVYAQPGDSFDYGELYAIDPVSGARTQLRTITGTDVPAVFYGAAFALPAEPRAVPEPSLFWALAFLMLGWHRKTAMSHSAAPAGVAT
jgi:hypothetical protein